LLRTLGYDLHRYDGFGIAALADVRTILGAVERPVVLDVGANVGQMVRRVRDFMPRAWLHCFEPGPVPYRELERRYGSDSSVRLNRLALGSAEEERVLFVHESSEMSSFLPLGEHGWGNMKGEEAVSLTTVDSYCRVQGLDGLHDEPRPGKPGTITDGDVERVIVKTLKEQPANATHLAQDRRRDSRQPRQLPPPDQQPGD